MPLSIVFLRPRNWSRLKPYLLKHNFPPSRHIPEKTGVEESRDQPAKRFFSNCPFQSSTPNQDNFLGSG